MDFLRRELAPISPRAWAEIDAMARQTLGVRLSGRRFLDVDGPHGIAYAAAPKGRLAVPKAKKTEGVSYGVHQVLPLIEVRKPFALGTWDLDDIERGAKDFDLDPLVKACVEVAEFEEQAIYGGFKEASIVGLMDASADRVSPLKLEENAFMEALALAQGSFVSDGVGTGANLVVSPAVWKFLSRVSAGGSLKGLAESQLGGSVVYSEAVSDALMISTRGGDAELVLGQDLAIGYHSHTNSEVNLFLTESFTFRVIAPEALRRFKLS